MFTQCCVLFSAALIFWVSFFSKSDSMIKKPIKVKIILAVVKQPLSKVLKNPEKIQAASKWNEKSHFSYGNTILLSIIKKLFPTFLTGSQHYNTEGFRWQSWASKIYKRKTEVLNQASERLLYIFKLQFAGSSLKQYSCRYPKENTEKLESLETFGYHDHPSS